MNKPEETTVKRKALKKCPAVGVVHISATFNNTLITITDTSGNAIFSSSAGKKGFKGARKSTPFAAQVAASEIAQFAYDGGMRTVSVEVSGPGGGRESAMRALSSVGLRVTQLKDITPVPHNGCRPPKKRRV